MMSNNHDSSTRHVSRYWSRVQRGERGGWRRECVGVGEGCRGNWERDCAPTPQQVATVNTDVGKHQHVGELQRISGRPTEIR